MSEWWTYRPSDFLMFAPRIYWRLFESLNQALWPLQLWVFAAGIVLLGWVLRRRGALGDRAARVTLAVLAAGWALVAWAHLLQRLAPIHWVAGHVAAAFLLQAAGLAALAWRGRLQAGARGPRCAGGLVLLFWALLAHPWLAWAAGRPWQQAEVVGLAADPTAIATLGLLLLLRGATASSALALRLLWAVPLAWCVLSAATLWTMGSAQGWVLAGATLLAAASARAYGSRP